MSKITNDSLTRSGTGCFIAVHIWLQWASKGLKEDSRDLRSFVIRFDFESYVRFDVRFVLMVRFEIFESFSLSIVIRKETIGCG